MDRAIARAQSAGAPRRATTLVAALLPVLGLATASHAWLGGFENADGYQPFLNMVQNYNAGQYGPSSGYMAMSPAAITPGTGLWSAVNGGFASGGGISYATGHQNFDRTWVNSGNTLGSGGDQALVTTTGHEGWSGPALKYKYNFDAQDLGGVAPSATPGQRVKLSFWARGFVDGADSGGAVPYGYFGNELALMDSSGNVGFRLGLTNRAGGDHVTYWNGSSLFESTLVGNTGLYDRWDITIDLATQTVSASYFQFASSTNNILITGVPLESAMGDFWSMTIRTSPGVNNSKYSSWDDFSFFATPTPGTATLLAIGAVAAGRRRRA